jgi:hypothetical protein
MLSRELAKVMAHRLKSWESPRYRGRNDKGKGGSARQRQLRKQMQRLRQNLKADKGVNFTPLFFERKLA